MTLSVAIIGGDGIGPEVVGEGLKVLGAVAKDEGFDFETGAFPFGAGHFIETGHVLDDMDIAELRRFDAIYLGALGGRPNDPRLAGGVVEKGILLKLRFDFDQYINLRPVKLHSGIETPLAGKTPDDIDLIVVRENTEGLYCGNGGTARRGTPQEISTQEMIVTRFGCDRAIRFAFDLAQTRPRKQLTLVHKTNVLTYAGDTWHRTFEEVAGEYPGVEIGYHHVDACCMYMVTQPEIYDVVVVPNMFGDIITDLGAAIAGGMGIAASGNLNPRFVREDPATGGPSMFEPVHGSSPDIAGQNKANPLAAIDSLAMLLHETGRVKGDDKLIKAGDRVSAAVQRVTPRFTGKRLDRSGYSTTDIGQMVIDSL